MSESTTTTTAPNALTAVLPWLALGLGFSPVLRDLAANLRDAPAERITLFPLMLFAAAVWCARPAATRRHPLPGVGLIALGVCIELLGLAAGVSGLAALGLPLGVLGMCLWLGRPAPLTGALAFWWVPIPLAVVSSTSPAVESSLAGFAAALLGVFGVDVQPGGPLFLSPAGRFELLSYDAGYPAATGLSALGWYVGLCHGATLPGCAWRAVLGGLLGFALQPIGVTLAVACFGFAAPALAGAVQIGWPWLCSVLGWGLLAWRHRRAPWQEPASFDSTPAGTAKEPA